MGRRKRGAKLNCVYGDSGTNFSDADDWQGEALFEL